MEELKSLEELTQMDEKHWLMGAVSGSTPSLKGMHEFLSSEILCNEAPNEIKDQFNVAKNMALYSYYFYALAPEVHLKTYTLIEYALRIKANSNKRLMLKALIELAIKEKWIDDSGFRHINDPSPSNEWCREMIKVVPSMRNSQAHGSNMLQGDCLHHISVCADFINQLFQTDQLHSKSKIADKVN